MVHVLPKGSTTRPSRDPKKASVIGIVNLAPVSTATLNLEQVVVGVLLAVIGDSTIQPKRPVM
jgi:hypothetical protein